MKKTRNMELPLIVTSTIPVIVFLPLAYYFFRMKVNSNSLLKAGIAGGTGWSIVNLLIFIPTLLIIESSSRNQYLEIFDVNGENNRTILFWILFFNAVISEITRYGLIKNRNIFDGKYKSILLLGIIWGFSEFSSRYLFFFENASDNINLIVLLLFYTIITNTGLSYIQLRTEENTKFVMFATLVRFFTELAVFGAFGHNNSDDVIISSLTYIMIFHTVMVWLTIKVRKPVTNY